MKQKQNNSGITVVTDGTNFAILQKGEVFGMGKPADFQTNGEFYISKGTFTADQISQFKAIANKAANSQVMKLAQPFTSVDKCKLFLQDWGFTLKMSARGDCSKVFIGWDCKFDVATDGDATIISNVDIKLDFGQKDFNDTRDMFGARKVPMLKCKAGKGSIKFVTAQVAPKWANNKTIVANATNGGGHKVFININN